MRHGGLAIGPETDRKLVIVIAPFMIIKRHSNQDWDACPDQESAHHSNNQDDQSRSGEFPFHTDSLRLEPILDVGRKQAISLRTTLLVKWGLFANLHEAVIACVGRSG